MATETRPWTLEELHRLPDDGNKYELIRGELFVTPPPGEVHETILAKLSAILTPYVVANRLGLVYHPRAVVRFEGSEAEPDLMVRIPHPDPRGDDSDWTHAPTPMLVIEVLSAATRRRDPREKKDYYLDAGVPEYWIVDGEERTVTVVRCDSDSLVRDRMTWHPEGAGTPLSFAISEIFEAML